MATLIYTLGNMKGYEETWHTLASSNIQYTNTYNMEMYKN